MLRAIVGGLPTALVIVLLAGVGLWGSRTGWAVSKFSDLDGRPAAAADDWCAEHGIAEADCETRITDSTACGRV